MSRAPRPATRALCCLLAATLPLQGCAWLFQSKQGVLVSCATPGATLIVDGRAMPMTPRLQLETGVDHVVQCVAEGYAPKTIRIAGHDDIAVNWLICDILWILVYGVGVVFLLVDFTTETIWDLDPRKLVFNLDPLEQPEPEPGPAELARVERREVLRPGPEPRPERRPETDQRSPLSGAPQGAGTQEPPLAERVEPTPQVTKVPPAPEPAPTPQVTKKPPPRPTTANPLAQGTTPATTEAGPTRPDQPPPPNPLADPPLATGPAIEANPASATERGPVVAPSKRRSVHVLTIGVDAPADPRLEGDSRRAKLAAQVADLQGAASASSLYGGQATRRAALAAVAEREGELQEGDVLVVVVAAPACVDPDGTAWLLLADSDPTALEDTALDVDVLTGGLERAGAGTKIVAVFAAPAGGAAGDTRPLDAAALGPGIVRVVAKDSKGAESIASVLEKTLEDLTGAGVLTDVDGNGTVTPQELAAYLKGRAIGCEVAPP